MELPESLGRLLGGNRNHFARLEAPEEHLRRVLILLHGLLLVLGARWVVGRGPGYFDTPSLVLLTMAGVLQVSIYFLPDGFISNRRYQRAFIVLGLTMTASWLVPACLGAGPTVWFAVALILLIPLIWDSIIVWVAATAGAVALVLAGLPGPSVASWDTEFLVVESSMVAWVALALVNDSLRSTSRLRRTLSHERIQARVVTQVASSLLSATDVQQVFRAVSQALNDSLGIERCLMISADPIRQTASLVAISGTWDSDEPTVDLSDNSPLHRALTSGKEFYVHSEDRTEQSSVLVITANSGLGMPLMICCELENLHSEPARLALVERVAQAAVTTIRNVQLLNTTQEKAQTDPLTGLPNRRSFQSNLNREFERARRHERPLSLLMIDLDFLKSINDRHGHPVGDSVIRTAADQIIVASRGSDYLAARYGGEEFAVILPETDLEGAVAAARRICKAIADTELPTVGRFTASIGAACFPVNAVTLQDLIETADSALYDAKRAGRNQVAASVNHTLL